MLPRRLGDGRALRRNGANARDWQGAHHMADREYPLLREVVSPQLRNLESRKLRVALAAQNIDADAAEDFLSDVGHFLAPILPAVGAAVGSIIPGVGTAIGGALGTAAGGLLGAATQPSAPAPAPPPAPPQPAPGFLGFPPGPYPAPPVPPYGYYPPYPSPVQS